MACKEIICKLDPSRNAAVTLHPAMLKEEELKQENVDGQDQDS